MKVFYEAVEKPTLETFEKTVSYWIPKSYKNIVKGSVAFFLLFSLFFLVFRGYSLAIICFVSAIFLVIEYRICKKRMI